LVSVTEAVLSRRSMRVFLDKQVDKEILVRVLEKARFTPSGGNVQPWQGVVLAGDKLKGLIQAVGANLAKGVFEPEYEIYPPNLPEPYRTRRFASGEQMYAALGIPREDKAGRLMNLAKNFQGFGAPAMLFCYTPDFMGKPQWSDLGMWLQTIMLLLREEGVDTCPQEAWSGQGKTIKEFLGIGEGFTFFCGIAIGYADPSAPVNLVRIDRASLEETVRFEGF